MNSKLASCVDSNKKTAKIEAATIALNELRRHCYTVKVKRKNVILFEQKYLKRYFDVYLLIANDSYR